MSGTIFEGSEERGSITGRDNEIIYKGKPVQPLNSTQPERNLLTVVHTVHHQLEGEQPRTVQDSYTTELTTPQETYSRSQLATTDWVSLDFGWLEPHEVGMIVIQNLEGRRHQVNPSNAELEHINSRIIELTHLGQEETPWPIFPKRSFVAHTEYADKLIIRCRYQQAKFRLTLIPK